MSMTMTIRLEDAMKDRLEQLATVTQRSKSFLAAEAIRAFVESNEWQINEINLALKEADAQDYATDQDLGALKLCCPNIPSHAFPHDFRVHGLRIVVRND